MKKIIHFIGIDVSKETLDIALIRHNDKSNITPSLVSGVGLCIATNETNSDQSLI